MIRLLAVLAVVSLPTSASAALAPNYQRAKELTAIIDAVAAKVAQHPITKIIYQKPDRYRVIAGPCSIRASIVSTPTKAGLVGARQFTVRLGVPRCRR